MSATTTKDLEEIPFFKGLEKKELAEIAKTKDLVAHFEKGAYLIREGESGSTLFILLEGVVQATKEAFPDRTLALLKAGSVFGEMSFLTDRPRFNNIIADSSVKAICLDRVAMESFNVALLNKLQRKIIDLLVQRVDGLNSTFLRLQEENASLRASLGMKKRP